MNEIEPTAIIDWLFGVVVIVLGFLGKRLHDRVDEHAKKHVTRDELKATLQEMRDDRQRMHSENREELRYIRDRVDDISDRQQ